MASSSPPARRGFVAGAPTLSVRFPAGLVRRQPLPPLLRPGRSAVFFQARYALWHGLRALGLGAGDNVLFPALHCGTELDPFLALGVEPRFYEPEGTFGIPVGSLESLADARTRALLVIHYLGLPQDLRGVSDLCRRRGWRLIEDCAHTLPAPAGNQGSAGDISIFSLRKLLPLPDGGALCLNAPDLCLPEALPGRPPLSLTLREVKKKLAGGIRAGDGWVARRARRRIGRRRPAHRDRSPVPSAGGGEDLHAFRGERCDWRCSRLSGALLRSTDWRRVAEARRRNFSWLLRRLPETPAVLPAAKSLADEACPWMFPVLTGRPQALIDWLLEREIEIGRFWQHSHPAFPAARFPRAASLKERLLALPVHQDLREGDLERIAEAVRSFSG